MNETYGTQSRVRRWACEFRFAQRALGLCMASGLGLLAQVSVAHAEPELVEPKLVEPKLVEPKLVEPKLVEPKLVEPKLVEPERADFNVVLRATSPGRKFIVSDARSARVVAHCEDACELRVPQGIYLVEIPGSEGSASGNAKFVVNGPGGWDLEDASRTTSWIGLGLIAVGAGAFIGGYELADSATPILEECTPNCQDEEAARTRMRWGNLGMLTGAIATPLGIWMYFAHRRATLTPSYATTMAFDVSPAHGWVGVRVQF